MGGEPAELNVNEIVTKLILESAKQSFKGLSAPVVNAARKTFNLVTDAYAPFLESTFQRVRHVKTFLKPNEPADLLAVYVPAYLSDGQNSHEAEYLIRRANRSDRVIITGIAGRGKSILLRYTAISMYNNPKRKIPLFLELRALNDLTVKDILQYLHAQYASKGRVKFEDFEVSLRRGYFSLIFDGFDEVEPASRGVIEAEILEISRLYPEASIIVSSRPDPRFQSWQDFTELQVCPMGYQQARDLIKKADYDQDVKRDFLKKLNKAFFEKYESFLSTPLLTIMMMLTFEDYKEIPTSLHSFYKNAFDTLIRRHDATKPKFNRKMHSNCTAEQFQLLFSSFCLLSYSKSKFEFSSDEAKRYIEASLKQQQISADPGHVLIDLIESICLLQQEGFEISFVHRSFQEYFCALFLSLSPAGLVKGFLDTGRFRVWDDMLPMLYGMARDRIEQEWAIDATEQIISNYSEENNLTKYVIDRYYALRLYTGSSQHVSIGLEESVLSRKIAILERIYRAHFLSSTNRHAEAKTGQRNWHHYILSVLSKYRELGDDRLQDFDTKLSGQNVVIHLRESDTELIDAIGLDKFARGELAALKEVREDQRIRQRDEDTFLAGVFGHTNI